LSGPKRYDEALAAYARALTHRPDLAGAWIGRGNILHDLGRDEDSLAAYDRAVACQPDLAEAWLGRAHILGALARYDEAAAAFDRALQLEPDLKYLAGHRLNMKMLLCDWSDWDSETSDLLQKIKSDVAASTPFPLLAIPSSASDQQQCARRYAQEQGSFPALWRGEIYEHARPRLCYVSSDLRQHAVGFLTAGLFEQHDKDRFELFAISTGPDDGSDVRQRMQAAAEHFIDATARSDQEVAELMREAEIDIAVDLNGFTQGGRLPILARRPAPIQVNYLGYSATMGADFIDYIIADETVIPRDQQGFYTEKVAYLPDTYMATDDTRKIADVVPSRAELGLPEHGFVFCSFNNTFKFNPAMFDIWMRLLREVEGSVLWFSPANAGAQRNLCGEAATRGIAADRLVFATRTASNADHLARHAQADLFLDTLPYNAHTTTSDALWAGLPVVTSLGATFAGRVAASLLHATGLPELVTASLEDYEALALNIARDPALLAALKSKLARQRRTSPLFDTKRFARHVEAAYTTMWETYKRGETPCSFAVQPQS
jgi:predicted O-linked N-acetylglucosamine transferase (SPINDLY family)